MFLISGPAQASYCGDRTEVEISPEDSQWTGIYRNNNYDYTVLLPEGITAYNTPPPSPQHGFVVVLSKDPAAYIGVDSSYNSAEFETVTEGLKAHLGYIQSEAKVVDYQFHSIFLGNLRGIELTVTYLCPGERKRVEIYVATLQRSLWDQFTLATTPSRARDDLKVLYAIVQKWRPDAR
jgi:hypothetical protein